MDVIRRYLLPPMLKTVFAIRISVRKICACLRQVRPFSLLGQPVPSFERLFRIRVVPFKLAQPFSSNDAHSKFTPALFAKLRMVIKKLSN